MKNRKKGQILALIVILLSIVSVISIFLIKQYSSIYGENAIIFVIGETFVEKNEWSYDKTYEQIQSFKEQYGLYWENRGGFLANKWDWDFYFHYSSYCNFARYEYKTLLVIFDGHGTFTEESGQVFAFNDRKTESVSKIAENFNCENLTVVVESCYSFNWRKYFIQEYVDEIYSSDLEGKRSFTKYKLLISPVDGSISILKIDSFVAYFVDELFALEDYSSANMTAITKSYDEGLTGID